MGGPQIQSLISHFAPADFYSFIDDCNISFSLLAWLGINYPYKRDVWCNTVFSESLWSQSPGFVRINKYFTVFVVLVMWLFTRSPFWNCIWLISHNSRLPNTLSLCHFSLASAFSCISRPRLLRDQLWNKDKLQRAYQFYFTKLRHAGYQVRSSWCADQRRKEEELSLLVTQWNISIPVRSLRRDHFCFSLVYNVKWSFHVTSKPSIFQLHFMLWLWVLAFALHLVVNLTRLVI